MPQRNGICTNNEHHQIKNNADLSQQQCKSHPKILNQLK